jgi:hypothetical protein
LSWGEGKPAAAGSEFEWMMIVDASAKLDALGFNGETAEPGWGGETIDLDFGEKVRLGAAWDVEDIEVGIEIGIFEIHEEPHLIKSHHAGEIVENMSNPTVDNQSAVWIPSEGQGYRMMESR